MAGERPSITATGATGVRIGDSYVFDREVFPLLLDALRARGYTVIGPTIRAQAIVYNEIASVDDLPGGYTDEQEAATYRLKRRGDAALFGYNVGPHSWKRYLHPPRLRLWSATRDGTSFRLDDTPDDPQRYAFLGVRACELAAIGVQDRVFLGGPYVDSHYATRRERACLIAVNCSTAGATCFCASMGTGPRATDGYDLCLTELLDGNRHVFLVEVGTELGAALLADIPHMTAAEADIRAAERVSADVAAHMGRTLDTSGIADLLIGNAEHPRWEDVANRCLTCGNCTAVCPTCFCTTVEDVTDLSGERAERWRTWDSCFTLDFSYIHGGSVRATPRSRYRQWMTHKLATWYEQFGTSGCVGCGRCITWCPAAIDITEEVRAIRGAGPDPRIQ